MFFTNINISFSNLRFDFFSIIAKKVDQIRDNVVCAVACLVFVCRCALTTGRCNAFQHIFGNKKKSEFYGPYFQTMLFLVTIWKGPCEVPSNLMDITSWKRTVLAIS